jgi:hypothetical protein
MATSHPGLSAVARATDRRLETTASHTGMPMLVLDGAMPPL